MSGTIAILETVIDTDLGAFLRSRREATTPAEVGLPTGLRRRTPGLRRAEVATLAGISVDYLTRLEQGRDHHPSAQVLAALADALHLGEDDRATLRQLEVIHNGAELCPLSVPPARAIRPPVQAVLDRLDATPALVVNRLGDVLAWTASYERLVGPIGVLEDARPNLLRFTLADRRARTAYPEWDRVADELVSVLKSNYRPDDDEAISFIERLTAAAGGHLTERLGRELPTPKGTGVHRLAHPAVGELRLAYETLQFADVELQQLVVYLPADQATSEALDRLDGRRPGALRAVGDG